MDSSSQNEIQNQSTNPNFNATDPDFSGDKGKTVTQADYFRKQANTQIVGQRTPEQQRIFEEYFVVKNFKTTTWNHEAKTKAAHFKVAFSTLGIIGLFLALFGLYKNYYEWDDYTYLFDSFRINTPIIWITGLLMIIAAIPCLVFYINWQKKFQDSVEVKIAPKKLLTDAEYEELVCKKIESMNIGEVALERLGLDIDQVKEIHPIVLKDKVITKNSLIVYNRKDLSSHSSTQHVTYLYFTDEQLFVYKIQFDMCCNVQTEWAHEFFYQDICDIQSCISKNTLKINNNILKSNDIKDEAKDDFEIEYSTVTFNIVSSNSMIGFEIDGKNENIDSIQAMKQKIREKKAQG